MTGSSNCVRRHAGVCEGVREQVGEGVGVGVRAWVCRSVRRACAAVKGVSRTRCEAHAAQDAMNRVGGLAQVACADVRDPSKVCSRVRGRA
eukprot:3453643-Pleurochrysis_carterae.AAC.1